MLNIKKIILMSLGFILGYSHISTIQALEKVADSDRSMLETGPWTEIYEQRDKILAEAAEKGFLEKIAADDELAETTIAMALFPIFTDTKNQLVKDEIRRVENDPSHFSNTDKGRLEPIVREYLRHIIETNHLYHDYKIEDFGILDLSRADLPKSLNEMGVVAPISIGPNPNKKFSGEDSCEKLPSDYAFLRANFPTAKHVVAFEPRLMPNIDAISAQLGHELGHTTQSYHSGIAEITNYSNAQLAEIDADIKGISCQQSDGSWKLAENYVQIISSTHDFLQHVAIELCEKQCEARLLAGVNKKNSAMVTKILPRLSYMAYKIHPHPQIRLEIMNSCAKEMLEAKTEDKPLSNKEFDAMITCMAARYNIETGNKYSPLMLERLAEAQTCWNVEAELIEYKTHK